MVKFKDAKKILEFDIITKTKGFIAETTTVDGIVVRNYFQYKEIHQVIHHPDKGVEIVNYNERRKVFYNDEPGESLILFDAINNTMLVWMNSNLN